MFAKLRSQNPIWIDKLPVIFGISFGVRLLFSFAMGINNHFGMHSDSGWLNDFAVRFTNGDLNFDIDRFIASPLYPVFEGTHILLFGKFWQTALLLSQHILLSLSCVYLIKTSRLIFDNNLFISRISFIFYCFFPFTFWYVNTFCQEPLFQACFVFAIYHLIAFLHTKRLLYILYSSTFLALAFLTKSHILLFTLFIPFIFWFSFKKLIPAIKYTALYAFVCIAFALPYGVYHWQKNEVFVLSSNGGAYQFYLGNTQAGYISVVKPLPKTSPDYAKMGDMNNYAGYFNNHDSLYTQLIKMPAKGKQKIFTTLAFEWIKANPGKFTQVKLMNLYYFLLPGFNYNHYPLREWLFSFALYFPLYLLAYIGILYALRHNFGAHTTMLSIFLTMCVFSVVWFAQSRFRTITVDPFYMLYAAYAIYRLANKFIPFKEN